VRAQRERTGSGSARRGVALIALALALALGMATASAARADATVLGRFLEGLKSLRATFSESVADAHGKVVEQSSGELLVLRPGRFRWEIHPSGQSGAGQVMIADGRNLWFYDRDLAQVTVRPMDAALSATPAMLLSGGPHVLEAFAVSDAGRSDGLDWVRVVPKAPDADFRDALFGFAGNTLKRMILNDKLGETATLNFARAERNAPVAMAEVSFTPPPGADVIGKPAQ